MISLVAALHVLIFTAAFPFFDSVDEPLHFDLVVRYSQGRIPRGLEKISPGAVRYVVLFSSRAYLSDPADLPGGRLPPPLWTQPAGTVLPFIHARMEGLESFVNPESSQPPLYYAVAGTWWRAGKLAGISGEQLLYWLRFLNILVVVSVVWLGWLTARCVFPDNVFVRLAVPALVAFIPQTTLYSINNDVLTPLVFGAAFLLLLKFWQAETPASWLAAVTGLALEASYLTKLSTLPMLAVSFVLITAKMVRLAREKKLRAALPALAILAGCAALPILAWMVWCKINYGDLTGSAMKIQNLGWTDKPFSKWFSHPLFTPHGLWIFIGDTFSTFWQGEFLWFRRPLAIPALNWFYSIFTIILLALAGVATWKRPPAGGRTALWFAFACLLATFAFYALLSVKFDFQNCFYPSRAHPYFTSGRLFLGILVPILLLVADGLDFALQKLPLKMKFTLLAALLLFMLAGEIAVDWRVFPNEYNWYHA